MNKIAIIGLGNIGKLVPYFLQKNKYHDLTVFDIDKNKIKDSLALCNSAKQIKTDLQNNYYDLVFLCLNPSQTVEFIKNNHRYLFNLEKIFISITRIDYSNIDKYNEFDKYLKIHNIKLIVGCGLEPGLTEVLSQYLVNNNKDCDTLKIYCGGLPLKSKAPFYYSLLFGDKLPFVKRKAFYKENNQLIETKRFESLEKVFIDNFGQVEAFYDGMLPFFNIDNIKNIYQKTIRWSGYARAIKILDECGLFSDKKLEKYDISPNEFTHQTLLENNILNKAKDMVLLNIILYKNNEPIENFKLKIKSENNISAMAIATIIPAVFTLNEILTGLNVKDGVNWMFEIYNNLSTNRLLNKLEENNFKLEYLDV